jgi:hypothetical protein
MIPVNLSGFNPPEKKYSGQLFTFFDALLAGWRARTFIGIRIIWVLRSMPFGKGRCMWVALLRAKPSAWLCSTPTMRTGGGARPMQPQESP